MDRAAPDLPVDPLEVLRQRRSAKWQTYPADVLPLTVAEMDFALADPVAEALREAVNRSDAGYAQAVPDLGKALADFAARRWNWDIDPMLVTAVTDVGVGVVELLRVLTRPGDAVVISPPVYPPFFDWVPEAGARPLEVPLAHTAAGWRLDLAALEAAFATHPAAYVLCNPHNPVGRVHTADELASLVRLARIYRVTIISDEIHGPLVLPGATFTPLLTVPGAAEVAVSVLSASKAWNLAGLKCAAVVTAAPGMATAVSRFPADTRWRIGHFGVIAAVAAFTAGERWLDQLLVTLGHRRALLFDLLSQRLPMLIWHPPEATFLAWLNCAALGPDNQARERFLDHGRVALEPGLRFGAAGSGYARLNFATSTGILDQATARMASCARPALSDGKAAIVLARIWRATTTASDDCPGRQRVLLISTRQGKEMIMATFVLIHGAGDVGWYWHLVEQELRRRGHDTLAPDLPCDDDSAGLAEYTDTVLKAIGGRRGLIVVAQSFGGFTAPLVAARVPVNMLILVAGMVPAPGESPDDWSANTGFDAVMGQQAQRYAGQDLTYQDVPPALAEQARRNARDQSGTPGHAPWPLDAWPPVPTRFVLCTEDRFFPPEFMRRVVADRLGIVPDEMAAGHAVALSRPTELASLLASYLPDLATGWWGARGSNPEPTD